MNLTERATANVKYAAVARAKRALQELERRRARDSLDIYAGMHIPAEIEDDELPGLEKLPIAARYVPAVHHRLLNNKLEALERGYVVEDGKKVPFKRLMVFMPPGSAKSTYGSVLFPSWYLGRNPRRNVIQGSYNSELACRFGRRARNALSSEVHRAVFRQGLGAKKADGEWETEQGGEYFAFGMKTGVTGRRADLVVIDDAIKGRKEADSKTERDNVWETYKGDIRTRMKPNCAILYIATRWHEDDPAGRILPSDSLGKSGWVTAKDGERWYVLSLVAVVETKEEHDYDPLGRDLGEILWPEWFTEKMLLQEKKTQGPRNWASLYQQKPRPDEGAILKAKHWRKWPSDKPPKCIYVVSVYDTAFEKDEENDYSARTSWGIFWHEEPAPDPADEPDPDDKLAKWRVSKPIGGHYCMILLERFKDRVEFPELRRLAIAHQKEFKPDRVLIEKKASGHSLIQELRRAGIRVGALEADRSKTARASAAAVTLDDGCVWYMDRKWAEEVIEECAAFPNGLHDDITDTVVHAINWMRTTYHIETKGDRKADEDDADKPRKKPPVRLLG